MLKKSGLFDAEYYLRTYPDVKESGMDPLRHFILNGLPEGRNPSRFFNTRYYLENNPDLEKSNVTPFLHFMTQGWREGRNPAEDFNVEQYLEMNPDVKAAGINPLVHYIKNGMSEGRLTKVVDYVDYEEPVTTHSPGGTEFVTAGEMTKRMISLLISDRTVISISNGNELQPAGDVQIYISQLQRLTNQVGQNYLHVYPKTGNELLLEDGNTLPLGVNFNGESIGTVRIDVLLESLQGIHTRIVDVDIHHTMGWNLSTIDSILELNGKRGNFWLHDYFSLCPSFNLLRNDKEYCSAPEISSNACTICRYSNLRTRQQAAFLRFFAENDLRVIAPSKFALDLWLSKAPYKISSSEVRPLARLDWKEPAGLVDHPAKIRIVYPGHPKKADGWDAWLRLVNACKEERIEYFQLYSVGSEPVIFSSIKTVFSSQTPSSRIAALRDTHIDAVLLWSIWPETFSITLCEALAAGCFIITNRLSGSIQEYLTKNPHHGAILENEAELHAFVRDGELARRIAQFQKDGKPQAELVWVGEG